MSIRFRTACLALLVAFRLLAASSAIAADAKPGAEPPKRYASPTAVFEAYREARGKREWRQVFFCLTPDEQKSALFEALFTCGMHESKEQLAILKRHGLDEPTFTETLKKEYKAKHGVDPGDNAELDDFLNKEYRDDPAKAEGVAGGNEAGPVPRNVMCNIVAKHVKDKVGFFEAVAKLSTRPISPLGDLERVVIVDGDKATGHAKLTYIPSPGESPRIVPTSDKTFRFRKIDGRWLLDSL